MERKYVPTFVMKAYPHATWRGFQVPITPIPAKLKRRYPTVDESYFTKYRRYCDAVVVTDDKVLVIEGKIRRPIDGLGQLLLYRHYAPQVPELKKWHPRPFVPMLVTPKDDPYVKAVCGPNGFKYVIFKTSDSLEYLREKGFIV